MDKLKMQAKPMDVVLKKVMEICPAAVQNGKVDFDRLRKELADAVDDSIKESYDFTWVGKRAAIVEANKPINKTLRPAKDESKNWDTTENLYIEGDNLEVLKLLQESYLNKVKMIYIDPPYNTGKDFVYKDNFKQSKDDNEEGIGLFDEEGKKMFRNTETNGRFHSDWCSMMYPRLKLARDFLTDDGVIFISINDIELANIRKIGDEIFGEDNFVCTFNRKGSGGRQDSMFYAVTHEYIVCYAKNASLFTSGKDKKELGSYPLFDGDKQKKYKLQLLRKWGENSKRSDRPNLYYAIKDPDGNDLFPMLDSNNEGRWRWGNKTMSEEIEKGNVEFKKKDGAWIAYEKLYEPNEEDNIKLYNSWIDDVSNSSGAALLKELFNEKIFDYPKPVDLIVKIIKIAGAEKDSIILDFFSGSSTTAHAVMQLNAEDGGKRKFIMVQLPEETDKDSEAFKAGYKNICEIGKERIRRAGEKIKAELQARHPELVSGSQEMLKLVQHDGGGVQHGDNPVQDLDIGFRVLKLADSNMQDVYYTPADISKKTLLDSVDNIKNDRKPLDLLFGVMVDWGVSLNLPLREEKIGNNTIHIVDSKETDGVDLVACFDTNITPDTITKMATFNPTRAVFRDACFAKDDAKINMMEIFKATCGWDEKQAKDSVKVI